MTIIRQAHHKKYVSITNKLAQNNDLSLQARGLMLYFLSLPDNWEVHVNHLMKVLREGRNSILKILSQLRSAGYVHSGKIGFQGKTKYYVFEEPMTGEEFKKFLQSIQNPNCLESKQFRNPHPYKRPIAPHNGSPSSPSDDVEENEPNRTEPIKNPDRIGSNGSTFSSEGEKRKALSLEEVEMVCEHALQGKIHLKHSDVRLWTKKYGFEKTIQAVDLAIQDMKSGSLLTNPAGWITNALKQGY